MDRLDKKLEVEIRQGAESIYILADLYHYPIKGLEGFEVLERKKRVETDILKRLGEYGKFVKIFVILHEVETWILADSDVIKKRLKKYEPKSYATFREKGEYSNLEQDGEYSTPAIFLDKIFKSNHPKKYGYDKAGDGTFLLENANWEKIYATCSVFKALVDALRKDCLTYGR